MSDLSAALRRLEKVIESRPMEPEKVGAPPTEKRVTRRVLRDKDGRIERVTETGDDGVVVTKIVTRDEDHRIAEVREVHGARG